ncbi:glycine betaine ABC transporter substrate-binding protein [Halalkalicoccus salilacus]|uniref:glycine betaine ABC transporter substrate-binding protein n=1 Tax=Halalkalicoccus sp. GCM10025704 TaxID=3252662 RepID=UPI00361CF59A
MTTGTVALGGCADALRGDSVDAASMQWSEARLLGYMGYEVLNSNTDLEVNDEIGLGGARQCFEAVSNGEVDFYHLYTGGAWATIPPQHDEIISDPDELYERIREEMEAEHGLQYLRPASYNNTYGIGANPQWAEETGIETISGLAEHVIQGNTDLTVVLGPEFQERSDGWPGLVKHYGFEEEVNELDTRSVSADLTYEIIGQGESEIGMVFTTNPNIEQFDLVVLEDDEEFFLPYNPAPLVNGESLRSTRRWRRS